jgi:MFS family permease
VISLLRQRNFGLLWSAGLLALIGDWAFYGAMPIFVLDQTGSIFLSGLIWTLIGLPQVFIGPFAGVLVDRIDRKRVLFIGTLAQAVAAAILLLAGNAFGIWFAMGILLIQAIIYSIWSPAENAVLPTVVAEHELVTANSLNALNDNIARIVGPFVGAILYAWIDIRGIALVNAAAYLVAAALLLMVAIPKAHITISQSLSRSQCASHWSISAQVGCSKPCS